MSKFCTNCGKETSDGLAFCTECGTSIPVDAVPEAKGDGADAEPPTQPAKADKPAKEKKKQGDGTVVGTGTFFGLFILFAIPVIGWLICAVMAFASKNENKKHFSRAMLIWIVIGLVISVAAFFAFQWLGNNFMAYIDEATGGQFGDLKEALEQFKQFEGGEFNFEGGDFDLEESLSQYQSIEKEK